VSSGDNTNVARIVKFLEQNFGANSASSILM
jgi:hypothetical protein